MTYTIISPPEFKWIVRKHRKETELLKALERKIERLKVDPYSVGGFLSKELHGLNNTRLVGVYRLLFRIKEQERIVELITIDHRGHVYG